MNPHVTRVWEITAGAALIAGAAALGALWFLRKRPTPEEMEVTRRSQLTQHGRLVDGTLLEVCEVPGDDGRPLTMLIYDYRIGGVDYQCAQDITLMREVVDAEQVRAGFPCSVRYQPGHPQNSIVVSEKWSGLRVKVPFLHSYDEPTRVESHRLNGNADVSGPA